MHGVFLDLSTVTDGDLDLGPLHDTLDRWTLRELTDGNDVARAISDAEIVVSNKVELNQQTLETAGTLRLICIAATGTNNVDLAAARDRRIAVCNVPAYATTSVVEHVFMVILALNRRLVEYTAAVNSQKWQGSPRFSMLDFPFRELSGQTLGIIGYGELGKAVAEMARAFGMQILIAERAGRPERPGRCSLDAVLESADIISLHCPLTEETEGLIDMHALRKMKPGTILINTARGGIVNEADLLQALTSGEIAGAAIDVLASEPPVAGSPLLDIQLPNLIVTPHVAWAGRNSRQRLVNEVAENIRAFLGGNPRNVIN